MADQKTLANSMGVAMNLLFQDAVNKMQTPKTNFMPDMPGVPAPANAQNNPATATTQADDQKQAAQAQATPSPALLNTPNSTMNLFPNPTTLGNNTAASDILKAKI